MRPVSRGAELASLRPMSIWSGLNVALLALWKTNYRGCTLSFSEVSGWKILPKRKPVRK
jgi:hypothetical protein